MPSYDSLNDCRQHKGDDSAAETMIRAQPPVDDDVGSKDRPSQSQPLSGFPLYCVLTGVSMASFLYSLDIFILSTAIPSITRDFEDTSQIAWYPAAYALTTCALIPVTGKFATVFPPRWVYQAFFAIFLLGSVLCGAALNSNFFIVGRAVAGIGGAGLASTGITVVVSISKPAQLPMFMGLSMIMVALGNILAPIIGGALTDRVSWRWCFWINLPAGAVTVVSMFFFFKPQSIPSEKTTMERIKSIDIAGCFMFIPACFLILVALEWGGTAYSWNSGTIIGLFVGGFVLLVVFVGWQWWLGDNALIPGIVIGRRQVAAGSIFAFLQLGSVAVMNYYLPMWFQTVQGVSPLDSGVRVLPHVLSQILALGVSGVLVQKLHYWNPWFLFGAVLTAISAGLYTTFAAFDTPTAKWIGVQILQGIGDGVVIQAPSLLLQQDLKDSPLMSLGVSLGLFAQYLGNSVMNVIAGAVFNKYLESSLRNIPLSYEQINILLRSGTVNVRQTADQYFPDLVDPILESYNSAITRVYFVAVVGCGLAFVVALSLKWKRIDLSDPKEKTTA